MIVGVIAISLPVLTWAFAEGSLASISASYYEDSWSRTIFLGFLFAIASFLLAHNGVTKNEMILSKVASAAGLLVALYPCEVPVDANGRPVAAPDPDYVPYVHGLAAAAMFIVLAYFCKAFFLRAKKKAKEERQKAADRRAVVYVVSGVAIVLSIVVLAIDYASGHRLSAGAPSLTFWGETMALFFFGFAWLTASKCVPWLAGEEHFSPLREHNPAA